MKVYQINSYEGVGSTGRIARGIQQIITMHEGESRIAFGREGSQNEDTYKIGNKRDIYNHVLKTRILDLHGFGSKKATQKLIEDIKEFNPEIIHLHNLHGYYLNIEILFDYLKNLTIPVVWTLHDCWSFTGHCTHYEYSECNKWKTECHNCPEKQSYPTSILVDNSKENFHRKKEIFSNLKNLTLVTPSTWLYEQLEFSFLCNYNKVKISNGINLTDFLPLKTSFREQNSLVDKFIILGVASVWTDRKGLDYFKSLSNHLQEDEVIILVGVSDDLKKQLPQNIMCINKTNNITELAGLYSTADVFANPTLEDTFPTTNLEAQACGTPVITFRSGGSPESIIEGETGYVIDKENSPLFLEKIKEIKMNGKKKYFINCVNNAQKYDMVNKYNQYYSLYMELLEGNR